MTLPSSTADLVLDLALARAPHLGGTRLVCVDGPAGSGKTTLAAAVAEAGRARGHTLAAVHSDDVLRGWDGLPELEDLLMEMLSPLQNGRPGCYRRYDWHRSTLAETVTVPAAELVVLEGVGAGNAAVTGRGATLVWVEAPPALRLARGLERDGADLAPLWQTWMVAEADLHGAERTRDRAHLRIDGRTGTPVPDHGDDAPVERQDQRG